MKTTEPVKLELSSPDTVSEELLPEYRFDYTKAKPNRFAGKSAQTRTVELDADVAAVFASAEAVNKVLRALIEAMPQAEHPQVAS